MSRQSKARQRKIIAEMFTKMHLNGDKGPSQTKPMHGKVRTEHAARQAKFRADEAAAQAEAAEQAKKAANRAATTNARKKGNTNTSAAKKAA